MCLEAEIFPFAPVEKQQLLAMLKERKYTRQLLNSYATKS
jgi:hypothetical protein